MFLRALRVIFGFIAIWQILGLLPVLTNWLPNFESTTGGMWAIAFFKTLVLAASAAAYYFVGHLKKKYERSDTSTSELPIIGIAIGGLLLIGFALAIALPAIKDNQAETINADATSVTATATPPPPTGYVLDKPEPVEARPVPPPPPGFVIDRPSAQSGAPTFESKGWTQASTGSHIFDPYKEAQVPQGTRYYRDANGTIYRLYPPGSRPELEPANPFGLMDSTTGSPK